MLEITSILLLSLTASTVHAKKVGEHLKKLTTDSQLDADTKLVFKALIK